MQPLMLIVPDVQDVYTPLQKDLILPVSEVTFKLIKYMWLLLIFFIIGLECI
jgi:hypothetical protein